MGALKRGIFPPICKSYIVGISKKEFVYMGFQ